VKSDEGNWHRTSVKNEDIAAETIPGRKHLFVLAFTFGEVECGKLLLAKQGFQGEHLQYRARR